MAPPTAVFLMNLGGPQDQQEVRPYLYQLFKDPEILRLPAVLRVPLAWTIATLRAPSSRAKYALLGGGSPLVANTKLQAAALDRALGPPYTCYLAMRCGRPSTAEAVADALRAGAQRAVALPLYPQFAGATTRSSLDELVRRWPRDRPLAQVRSYPTDPLYIDAMAAAVREALAQLPAGSRRLVIFSAHGIPMRDVRAGDPYEKEARATAAAVVARCALGEGEWQLTYQSRVRPREWLGPDTVQTVATAARGRALVLVPLTFVSEHLETLYDLDILARGAAEAAGATAVVRAKALGERPEFIAALAAHVRRAAATFNGAAA